MRQVSTFFAIVAFTLAPQFAHAEIVPLAQLRQIVAGGSVNTVDESVSFHDTEQADDFGTFDDSTGLAIRTQFGTATADGFASQLSTITATSISVESLSDTFVYAPNEQDTAYGSTVSQFSLRFRLTTPGRYRVVAIGYALNSGTATMSLRDASDQELVYFDPLFWPPVDQVLNLPAGEYGLSAGVDSNGFFEYGNGQVDGRSEISVHFTQVSVPEPAAAVLGLLGALTLFLARRSFK